MEWLDEEGRPAKTKLQFPLASTIAQIQTAWDTGDGLIAALSGAGLRGASVTTPLVTTTTNALAVAGTNTAMDKSRWTWLDDAGNEVEFQLPAPLAADVNTDDYTINEADPDVAAFIAWVIANLESPYGRAIVAIVQAVRVWRNRKAKNT